MVRRANAAERVDVNNNGQLRVKQCGGNLVPPETRMPANQRNRTHGGSREHPSVELLSVSTSSASHGRPIAGTSGNIICTQLDNGVRNQRNVASTRAGAALAAKTAAREAV